jgi:histidinol-phosphate phosphatase family protein
LKELGFRLIVVTNQRCIGKGLISADEMDNICLFMNRRLESCGAGIDRFYYCPHDYSNCCDCRKPKPGLIQTAARDMCLDVKSSYMIGDSEVDVGAGLAAECKLVCYISRKKYQNNRVLNCRDIWDAAVRIKENTQEVPLCLRRER